MSTEGNSKEAVDFGHQDNPPPYYENATSRYEQSLPVMDTTQPPFYPPPPDYLQVLSESQPGGMVNPPPYPSPPPPQETGISLPQLNNNDQKIFQKPPQMDDPQFSTPKISEPTDLPSSPPAKTPEMLPPWQDPQNCPVPATVIVNAVQPKVVTTQTTKISSPTPPCRDYLAWSIVTLLYCFIFGIPALIYSIQTRSAIRHRNWELAKRKSLKAGRCNMYALALTFYYAYGTAYVFVVISCDYPGIIYIPTLVAFLAYFPMLFFIYCFHRFF
ncbi:uncharacterized protein LOC143933077 [Lithobates pipiens]